MERKDSTVKEKKFSVLKIRKHIADTKFKSDDFVLTSLSNLDANAERADLSGFVIGIVYSGTVKANVDGKPMEFRANDMFLITDDKRVESFRVSKACVGYLIRFSRSFVENVIVDVEDYMSVYMTFRSHTLLTIPERDAHRLHSVATLLSEVISTNDYLYTDKIISSLFTTCFYTLASILDICRQSVTISHSHRSSELLHAFMEMLTLECGKERSVEYYAKQLGITPKYLSIICRKHMNRNASKIIDEAVVRKAKSMLMQSGLSIAEVAEKLNFVSQSFFGKYFKQRVGMSPSRFKAQRF